MFSAKLLAEWHPTKNGTLKLTDFTLGSNKKVWWLCPDTFDCGCSHEFPAIIRNRVNATTKGCPHCAPNPTALCVHRSIVFTHLDIVKGWHPTKNGDLLPSMVRKSSDKEVWWLCPNKCPYGCLHEFKRSVDAHIRQCSGGCPFCNVGTTSICFHDSITFTHPDIAKEWHPTLNGNLKPTDVTSGNCKGAWWICTKNLLHMDYYQVISDRKNHEGCPNCREYSLFLQKENFTSLGAKFPEIAKLLHPTKNGPVDSMDIPWSSPQKLWWLCPEKCPYGCIHEYEQRVSNKTVQKHGCSWCATNQTMKCYHQSLEFKFPEIAKLWDHVKNSPLKPSEVSSGTNLQVWWMCKNGHSHIQVISDKVRGIGCSKCRLKTQEMVLKFLESKFSNVAHEKDFEWCPSLSDSSRARIKFDIVIEKIIIEVDGPQHFMQVMNWKSPEKQRESDVRKMRLAIDNGFIVIRILQVDVYYNKYDWKTELLDAISAGQNAFLCKNSEYDEMQTQLKV
jgi:hypothetical protein